MSDPIIVNQSTSVVHVDTSTVVYPRNAVVLLSTITTPGTIITIRDVTGYASTNRGISVSTMAGVQFLDGPGCNVYNINQPYGFLTVTPRTSNVWAVLNTFAFPDQAATPSVVGLYAQFGNFSNLYGNTGTINNLTVNYSSFLNVSVVSSMLAKSISTQTLAVSDRLSVLNLSTSSAFLSSVNINNSLLPSTSLDVNGSMRASTLFITKDAYIEGSLIYNTSSIVSTVRGLGTGTYVSSLSLVSTVRGLGTASYVSSSSLTSTVQGLGTSSYISSGSLVSTVQGLGTVLYISSASLVSSIQGLGSSGYVSSYGPGLESTVRGLGTSGYVSSLDLMSSIQGLGSSSYISSASLASSIQGLGTTSYISSASLVSTVRGLGTSSYVSAPNILVSSLSTHNFVVYGTSTFINSSNIYLGNNFSTNALRFVGTTNDGYYGDSSINPHTTTVIAERIYNTNAAGPTNNSELLLFKGSHDSNTIFGPDRVRVLTTGSFQVDIASNNGVWPVNGNPPSTAIQALIINTSGRVGISCNSPQYTLDVGGSINANSVSANGIPFVTASNVTSTVQGLGSSSYVSSLHLVSTVQGLGSSSFVSSLHLVSTVQGLGSSSFVSSLHLVSTVQGLGTAGFLSSIGVDLWSTVRGLGSSSYVSSLHLVSTVQGLGSSSFVSSLHLVSTVQGLGSSSFVSSLHLASTVQGLGTAGFVSSIGNDLSSTVRGLGSSSYVSSLHLASTLQGLGSSSYVSSLHLVSTVQGLGTVGFVSSIGNDLWSTVRGLGSSSYVSSLHLASTVQGLGTAGYLSSFGNDLTSTVRGLGSSTYVSSLHLASTVQGLGSAGYLSSFGGDLTSSIRGLGSSSYVSSLHLVSTAQGLGTVGYLSSISNVLTSTVRGLGSVGYLSTPHITISSISSQSLVVFGDNSSTILASCNIFIGNNPSTNALRFIGTDRDAWNGNILINPYANTVIAERLYHANNIQVGFSELLLFKGQNSATTIGAGTDRVRVLSAGGFKIDIASNGGSWGINGNPPSTVVEALTLISTGWVGINCNFPAYTLDINGSINVLSNIYVNGQSILNNNTATSTVTGLGTAGYVSSLSLFSTVEGLGSSSYVSSSGLISTVQGLGSLGFLSSFGNEFTSTVKGLGSSSYVSSLDIVSTVQGLGTAGYLSSFGNDLTSTVRGLGTAGYLSTPHISVSSISSQSLVVFGSNSSTILASCNIFIGNNPSTNTIRFIGTDKDSWDGNTLLNPYANTVIAERLYHTNNIQVGFSELLLFKGQHSATTIGAGLDRVRVLSAGGFKIDIASNAASWAINGNPPSTVVEALTVISTGWVGINCNIPAYTLDINGSINVLSNIYINGQAIVNNNTTVSTVGGLGASGYVSSSSLASTLEGLGTSSYVSSLNLVSTVRGLGTTGYVSSFANELLSTVRGLGSTSYVSSLHLASTVQGLGASGYLSSIGNDMSSTVRGLGSTSYVSSLHLASTVQGLGASGYLSSIGNDMSSTVRGLGSSSYVSSLHLASTVQGLGSSSYVSSLHLASTVQGLGSSSYVSSLHLASTVQGLGTSGYLSSIGNDMSSTIRGLGSSSYVSSFHLASTVQGLGESRYISSLTLISTIQGLGTSGYISSLLVANTINNSNMLVGNSFSTNMIRFYGTAYDSIAPFEDPGSQNASNFYTTTVIAERLYYVSSTIEGCSELLLFKGKNAYQGNRENSGPDRVRVLTVGGFKVDIASNGGIWLSNGNPPSTTIEALSVIPSGYVGINCNTPAYTLDVNGTINVSGTLNVGGSPTLSMGTIVSTVQGLGTANYVSSVNGRVSLTAMNLSNELIVKANGNGVARITSDTTSTYFQSANNAQTSAVPIKFTGYNGTPLLATIDANGNFTATGNVSGNDIIATSDFRLKTNIVTIDSPLEKISAMRGVYFHKISDSTMRKVGVIAQEIETVLPEVVFTEDTEEKMKGVSYGNIASILIEGMKAQQSSIQSLVTTISSLQSQIVLLQRPVL
jgi:hypothetical protein